MHLIGHESYTVLRVPYRLWKGKLVSYDIAQFSPHELAFGVSLAQGSFSLYGIYTKLHRKILI